MIRIWKVLQASTVAVLLVGSPLLAEEAIVPSGFTEAAYLHSCPIDTGGCATTYSSPTASDEGKMRFLCKDSHYSYEDPLVFPGTADATHLHMFFGNPHTGKDSTFASLRANVDLGTCAGGPLNNTGYWAPALIRPQSNQIVQPDFIELYYTVPRAALSNFTSPVCPGGNLQDGRAAACPMVATQRIERGMKAIFGYRPSTGTFPVSPGPAGATRNFDWSCTDGSSGNKAVLWDRSTPANGVQSCPSNSTIQVRMETPNCWSGSYDNGDHYTHLAYGGQDGSGNVVCPATHNLRIPTLTFIFAWKHGGQTDYSQWYLSSDRFNGANYEAGASFHTDVFWAWSQTIMDIWTVHMLGIQSPLVSADTKIGSDGPIGDGTNMDESTIGITSGQASGRYVAIPTRTHGSHTVRFNVH